MSDKVQIMQGINTSQKMSGISTHFVNYDSYGLHENKNTYCCKIQRATLNTYIFAELQKKTRVLKSTEICSSISDENIDKVLMFPQVR